MCLGIPGKIVEVWTADSGAPMARRIDEESARVTTATLREYGVSGAGT